MRNQVGRGRGEGERGGKREGEIGGDAGGWEKGRWRDLVSE